jgi:hypothetical protein
MYVPKHLQLVPLAGLPSPVLAAKGQNPKCHTYRCLPSVKPATSNAKGNNASSLWIPLYILAFQQLPSELANIHPFDPAGRGHLAALQPQIWLQV